MHIKTILICLSILIIGAGSVFVFQYAIGLQLGGNLNAGGFKITNVGVPTDSSDVVTQGYVNAAANSSRAWIITTACTTQNYTSGIPSVSPPACPSGYTEFWMMNNSNFISGAQIIEGLSLYFSCQAVGCYNNGSGGGSSCYIAMGSTNITGCTCSAYKACGCGLRVCFKTL